MEHPKSIRTSILIAIPSHDSRIAVGMGVMLAKLSGLFPDIQFGVTFYCSSLISLARNDLVRSFLKTDMEWLYFWDSDVVIHDEKFFYHLLETSEKLNADVVGAPYRIKSPSGMYAVGVKGEPNADNVPEIRNFKAEDMKEPMLVDALATGSMLIKRKVLETLEDPWFTIIDLPKGKVIPEDYNFCANAQKNGFKVAVDPRVTNSHFGYFAWNHNYNSSLTT